MKDKKNAKKSKINIKNIVKIKKITQKHILKRNTNNDNIIQKCNKKIIKYSKNDIEILNKINDFNTNGKKNYCIFYRFLFSSD